VLEDLLVGPTALTLVKGDAVLAAKAIATFSREHEVLEYKGGLMDGEPLDADGFNVIARLPGVDVLRGQLVGVAASPITGLARGLGSMLSGLAVALGQIAEQGLVTGEAPAEGEEEDAPPAEQPAEEGPPAVEEAPADEAPADEEETSDETDNDDGEQASPEEESSGEQGDD
jgi:large subunit ribosomal protein L10